jgi:hypothetical protein
MDTFWSRPATWLLHTAIGGGLLLLAVSIAMRSLRQPVRRQRLGELGLAAALLLSVLSLAPSWLYIPLEVATPSEEIASDPPSQSEPLAELPPVEREESGAVAKSPEEKQPPIQAAPGLEKEPSSPLSAEENQEPAYARWFSPEFLPAFLVGAFAIGSGLVTCRWLLGYLALWRLVRRAVRPPPAVAAVFASVCGPGRGLRLLVSHQLQVPISCGLFRPTVILPARLCESSDLRTLRWVFAHELTHLKRRDAWSCFLFGLGQAVFFYLPWFWGLRRQVRLCQEYVADAAVTADETAAADYAEFLLTLTRRSAIPAGATSVVGDCSDLFRRVRMMLQDPMQVEKHCPRRWSLVAACGLLGLAVVASGISLGLAPAPASAEEAESVKKEIRVIVVPVKPEKKEAGKPVQIIVTPKDKIIRLNMEAAPRVDLPVVNEKQVREIVERVVEELKKQVPNADAVRIRTEIHRALQGGGGQLAGWRVVLDPNVRGIKMGGKMIVLGGTSPEQIQKDIAKVLAEIKRIQDKVKALEAGKHTQAKDDPFKIAVNAFHRSVQLSPGINSRLGARLSKPSAALADQLDLPKDRGLVIDHVVPGSPADKAGWKVNDILLELNGTVVSSDPTAIAKVLAGIKKNTPANAVVLRKGKKIETKALTLTGGKRAIKLLVQPKIRRDIEVIRQPADFTIKLRRNQLGEGTVSRYQEGSLIITLTTTKANGKSRVSKVEVQDDGVSFIIHKLEGVNKLPEPYRSKVKKLLDVSNPR